MAVVKVKCAHIKPVIIPPNEKCFLIILPAIKRGRDITAFKVSRALVRAFELEEYTVMVSSVPDKMRTGMLVVMPTNEKWFLAFLPAKTDRENITASKVSQALARKFRIKETKVKVGKVPTKKP